MDYSYLHEVELIEFRSLSPRPISDLSSILQEFGFTIHDDVASLDRTDAFPQWQHPSIIEAEVLSDGNEVFGFDEGEWDTVRFKYLFATLPYALAETFIEVAFATSKAFALPVIYEGKEVTADSLRQRFKQIHADLLAGTGEEAGSENLAILIQSTYPRR